MSLFTDCGLNDVDGIDLDPTSRSYWVGQDGKVQHAKHGAVRRYG
jgi:hypothetical protein